MRIAIFANGDFVDSPLAQATRARCNICIAADGGARHCQRLSLIPHAVIGDMDSIDPDLLAQFQTKHIEMIRHPTEKNEIDLELALLYARDRSAEEISVFGGFGDRWDYTLANLLLLAQPAFQSLPIRFIHGDTAVFLLRAGVPRRLYGSPGDRVSLLPLAEDARGITLEGFRYPLKNEPLIFGQTRGLSNTLSASQGVITLTHGALLCFHTHQPASTAPPA